MTMSHWCLAIAKAHACMALTIKHMQMLTRPKMSAYEGLAAHKPQGMDRALWPAAPTPTESETAPMPG